MNKEVDNKQVEAIPMGKGLSGIQELFLCSRSMAFHIAHTQWFGECMIKSGKHILFDKEKALRLALERKTLYE